MYQPQVLTPERFFHPSISQVSCPSSPGPGTVWNSHSFFPVRASYARELPDGPSGASPVVAPTITTFLKIVGTPLYGTTISTMPSVPKPGSSLPVPAFSPINLGPAVNKIRGGLLRSPGQYAAPRESEGPPISYP